MDETNLEDEKDNMEDRSFQKVYGWYVVVNRVAENDFTRHEYVYKKKVMEVLNQLAYLIDYDKEQERMFKKSQNKR